MMARQHSSAQALCTQFLGRVAAALRPAVSAGESIVAAVSGGPDSMALLLALDGLKSQFRLGLTVAHANHQLRGAESDRDEAFVRACCSARGLPLFCRTLAVASRAADREDGIEESARKLRQRFFVEAAGHSGARWVATAHTADDQAETVLHRIVRGTGLAGLQGIPVRRPLAEDVQLIRPLLELRRREIIEYLGAAGQSYHEDRSNRDLTFTRNRVRHELIPYLERHFNARVGEALCRLAGLAAGAQTVIDAQVQRLRRRAVTKRDDRHVALDIVRLRRAPRFLVGELLRQLWTEQSWPLQEIGQSDLDRITGLVSGAEQSCDLPGDIRARRARGKLIVER